MCAFYTDFIDRIRILQYYRQDISAVTELFINICDLLNAENVNPSKKNDKQYQKSIKYLLKLVQ